MILEKFCLKGNMALVTGGGTGLGKAICLAFARAGADVVVASRSTGPINETADEVRKLGQRALAIPTDVTDSRQVNHLIEKAIAAFGHIDILVNNAGVARGIEPSPRDTTVIEPRPIWEFSDDMWRQAIDTNLTGTFYCCRAIGKHMIGRRCGKVINISSTAGMRAVRGLYTYGSAKAGVIMLSKILALTWARDNIQVNCIMPGNFDIVGGTSELQERMVGFMPMGRLGQPREIGPLAVFLASEASSYITGECFIIDGARYTGYAPMGYAPVIPLEN